MKSCNILCVYSIQCYLLCNAILPDYIWLQSTLRSVWTLRCQQQCQNGLKKQKAGERRFKMISTRKQKQLEDCKLSALEQRMYAWTCSNIVPEAIVFSPDIWRKSKQSSDSDYLWRCLWLQKHVYVLSKPGWLMIFDDDRMIGRLEWPCLACECAKK